MLNNTPPNFGFVTLKYHLKMQSRHPPGLFRSLIRNDLATIAYMLSVISFLQYNDLLLRNWNLEKVYIVIVFAVAEALKYIAYVYTTEKLLHRNSIRDLFKNLLVVTLMSGVVYVTAVLFGAPVFSNFQETGIFALLVTVLTALPVSLHLGNEATINMFSTLTSYEGGDVESLFMLKLRLTLFGAWLGAVVIPLDWNRHWQVWPIPCCVGTLIGYTAANCVTCMLYFQQKRKSGNKKSGKYIL